MFRGVKAGKLDAVWGEVWSVPVATGCA
jgi:hypothetical protein